MTLPPETTDLHILAAHHAEWSRATFGPDHVRGPEGPLDHLRREALEAKAAPGDVRAGFSSRVLVLEAARKLRVNVPRVWPDWRTADLSAPIEHVKHGCDPGTMDASRWALVRCDTCPEEYNCHPADELRMARDEPGGDLRPICESCWDATADHPGANWFAMPRVSIGPAAP